jgi:hypothetical protein
MLPNLLTPATDFHMSIQLSVISAKASPENSALNNQYP